MTVGLSLMSSVAKDAPLVASTTPTQNTENNMDEETEMLLHAERSCIFETRIKHADLCRQRGSAQYKAGDIANALTWYQRALFHVDFDEGTWHFEFTPKNRADVNVVRLPVYLNLAACYLAQGNSKDEEQDEQLLAKVIENANLALAIDPENEKALYRAGYALLLTGDLTRAKEKLTKSAQFQPKDKKIRNAIETLNEKLSEQRKEEKKRWGGRLLSTKKAEATKIGSEQQLMKSMDSRSAFVTIVIVLLGIALALGQLSFVE